MFRRTLTVDRHVTVTMSVTGHVRWGYAVAPVVSGVVGDRIRSGTVENKTSSSSGTARPTAATDARWRTDHDWVGDVSDNRTTRTFDIIRDTVPIAVTTTATPSVITPNGDGRNDTTSLVWTSAVSATSSARVFAADGTTARRYSKTGTSGTFTWDGRNRAGTWLPSGRYAYRVVTV